MRLIAKQCVNINGAFYNKGDEIKNISTKEQVIKLNELGFIEPLLMSEIQDFGKVEKKEVKIVNKKNEKEEK